MKRGRISANELNVIPISAPRERVRSPSNLSTKERQLFDKLLETCGHFQPSDFPLLVSFVQASLLAQQHRNPRTSEQAKIWSTAVRVQSALATKLRLAPNTRLDPKATTRRAAAYQPSAYDLMRMEDATNARDD